MSESEYLNLARDYHKNMPDDEDVTFFLSKYDISKYVKDKEINHCIKKLSKLFKVDTDTIELFLCFNGKNIIPSDYKNEMFK